MARQAYRLTESVAAFPEGEILEVTARFGDWHMYDMELEPRRKSTPSSPKIVVSESEAGFSEAEILDETARLGDWHEYDLAFDPGTDSGDETTLTVEELAAVAEPVDVTA